MHLPPSTVFIDLRSYLRCMCSINSKEKFLKKLSKKVFRNLIIRTNAASARAPPVAPPPAIAPPASATPASASSNYNDSFLNSASIVYVEQIYNMWIKDPKTVDPSWDALFNDKYVTPEYLKAKLYVPGQGKTSTTSTTARTDNKAIEEHLAIHNIVQNYQMWGHLLADLDPLELKTPAQISINPAGIPKAEQIKQWLKHDMKEFEKNLDKEYTLPTSTFIGGDKTVLPLKEIISRLEEVYCSKIGIEFVTVNSQEKRNWLRKRFESPGSVNFSSDDKRVIMGRLIRATAFENFLNKKWTSEKRFGLEGCDMTVPGMKQIIDSSSRMGVESIIIGMAHRGRLNVLANVCHKPLTQIFTQFIGLSASTEGAGDVKYHLGTLVERLIHRTNKNVRLSVVANPSHLEAVAPVAQGKTRAEQFYKGDEEGKKVMSILIHGDAAFSGQGVVFETMHLSNLRDYKTHGTIHIVINNQVGFTTDPRSSRSSTYCTDVAHVVNAPIFHVNADDPESVIHVCNVAAEWRATFNEDVVIDIVGYRRHGHNEMDEPMFTQPIMYKKIKALKPCQLLYAAKLVAEKIMTQEEIKKMEDNYDKMCEEAFLQSKKEKHVNLNDWLDSPWTGFFEKGKGLASLKTCPTGIEIGIIKHIGNIFSSPPPKILEFEIHKGIERILKARMDLVNAQTVDWALGEAMAFGSLLKDGIHIRLSGQDVERGTFSHRHHVLHHQVIDHATYCPLCHLYPDQAPYTVCNSSLSENAVLGFEVGFSVTNPNALVLWEAQFGDFNNNGQVIIDQFISSGQSKWIRQSGIVLLQPHGMEGMGPEHSSARLERFLQLSAEDGDHFPEYDVKNFELHQLYEINWIVANLTTPANYFHILRRQIALPFRKPLIIMSPKSLLRHPEAKSTFADMDCGTFFLRVIPDKGPASKKPEEVKKLIFCTGKVYYDLAKARAAKKLEASIAIHRVEQVSPFPFDLVKAESNKYKNARICWVQEEHKNSGAWTYVQPRMYTSTAAKRCIEYCGRAVSASPATGSKVMHIKELEHLLADAMDISTSSKSKPSSTSASSENRCCCCKDEDNEEAADE